MPSYYKLKVDVLGIPGPRMATLQGCKLVVVSTDGIETLLNGGRRFSIQLRQVSQGLGLLITVQEPLPFSPI